MTNAANIRLTVVKLILNVMNCAALLHITSDTSVN